MGARGRREGKNEIERANEMEAAGGKMQSGLGMIKLKTRIDVRMGDSRLSVRTRKSEN